MNPCFIHRVLVLFSIVTMNTIACNTLYGQRDTIPPATPVLKYITVDPVTGSTTLNWSQSKDPDVLGYVIYRDQNDTWLAIDSLFSSVDTTYTDLSSRAAYFPESYVVSSFDTSRNVSPLSEPHTTMFLQVQFDSCRAAIILNWSPYTGWSGISRYTIMIKEGNGTFLPADSTVGEITSDTITQITAGNTYCLYISASDIEDFQSSSNGTCLTTHMQQPPAYITASGAIISENKNTLLTFTPDPEGELNLFTLYRRSAHSGPWDSVTTISRTTEENIEISVPADTLTHAFYYQLAAVNPCGQAITWSNTATAIYLTGIHDGFLNHLSWTPYEDFPEGTDTYTVYRSLDLLSWTPVGTVTGNDTVFTDNIESLQYQQGNPGKYCYVIEATGKHSSAYPAPLISRSTSVCIHGEIRLFVPNVFTPDGDGINDFFAPVPSFAPLTFHMIIRNRWGAILYESTDYLASWDGTDKSGNRVPEGTYTYFIQLSTPDKNIITRSGIITVIYP